jgi:hypothetical protein
LRAALLLPGSWFMLRSMRESTVTRFAMRTVCSDQLREDLAATVMSAIRANGIVNVGVVAEQVRRRNSAENVALEDIELMVVDLAQRYGAVMEFDGMTSMIFPRHDGEEFAKRLAN